MEMSGQFHAAAVLPLGKNPVPLEWVSGWILASRSERFVSSGIQTPDHASHSVGTVPTALYRLLRCGKCTVICDVGNLVLRQPEVATKMVQCRRARFAGKARSRPVVASTECDVQQAAMRWWPWHLCVGMSELTLGTHMRPCVKLLPSAVLKRLGKPRDCVTTTEDIIVSRGCCVLRIATGAGPRHVVAVGRLIIWRPGGSCQAGPPLRLVLVLRYGAFGLLKKRVLTSWRTIVLRGQVITHLQKKSSQTKM